MPKTFICAVLTWENTCIQNLLMCPEADLYFGLEESGNLRAGGPSRCRHGPKSSPERSQLWCLIFPLLCCWFFFFVFFKKDADRQRFLLPCRARWELSSGPPAAAPRPLCSAKTRRKHARGCELSINRRKKSGHLQVFTIITPDWLIWLSRSGGVASPDKWAGQTWTWWMWTWRAAAADNDLYMRGEWRTETVRDIKQREDSD